MDNIDEVKVFKGSNTLGYIAIGIGATLLVFMFIMIPLLATKYTVDINFILFIGIDLAIGGALVFSGYQKLNKYILAVTKDHFEHINNGVLTSIPYANIKSINDLHGKFIINYERYYKELSYDFNIKSLAKDVRTTATTAIKRAYEEYKHSNN